VPWEVEATDEFGSWYLDLAQAEQSAINAVVDLLEERGPALGRPYADTIAGPSVDLAVKGTQIAR